MIIGSTVLATEQGLGYLAKAFFDNGVVDYVSIKKHSSRTNHYEWYPSDKQLSEEELLAKCDVLLFIEDPFNWKLIPRARELGKKTVLIPMYECTRNPLPYVPDLILSPSLLDKEYYPDSTFVHIPTDVTWKKRERARVFVHNAGNGGIGGRNGTKELLEAMRYVKSPIKLIVRSQVPINEYNDPRIEYRIGTFENIWEEGDVFVFPEKFNGLSLPLQEAYASGMAVMSGNRFPINTWLPHDILIPVAGYKKERIAVEFQSAVYNPIDIAATIDAWYNKDISELSLKGLVFNQRNSWNKLKGVYEELMLQLLAVRGS